jgi:23S rRNA (guanosine2251-2'-O)-methyltransferase
VFSVTRLADPKKLIDPFLGIDLTAMIATSGEPAGRVEVEGVAAVFLLLESPRVTSPQVYLETGRHLGLRERCRVERVPCEILSREKLDELAGFRVHRGVFATAFRSGPADPDGQFLESASRILVASDFGDPCVLGTLVRTAEAFGIDGVIVERGKGTDALSRKAIRASAGALLRLPVFEVKYLETTLAQLDEAQFVLLGLSQHSESDVLSAVLPGRKTVVIIGGNERDLSSEILSQCAQRVQIPTKPGSASLSIAAAGAAMHYELFGRAN